MDSRDSLNLKRLIDETQCENNTENIRTLKHSSLIRDDIRKIENLKKSKETLYNNDQQSFNELCQTECSFLFNNYTDIYNKVLKNELDLKIMTQLLVVLKLIEDGRVDQHEGSVMVGKILKELYIDSALKRSENIDKEHESERIPQNTGKPLSWKEFKQINNV